MACHKSFRSHLNVANDCLKRRHAIINEIYVTCYYTIPFVRTRKKERKVPALTFAVLCAQWSVSLATSSWLVKRVHLFSFISLREGRNDTLFMLRTCVM
ncbi:hypothetical protein CDAR_464411 [Caerostris darwini]|uniref:Uncharacterized protein n=1 Tax=Caerostris darwini TaxID=1538125 RepID=A0AAV4VUT1_9ARAC|nr:hypothetical protein CDAR_464411 [Caerostris darwini]